MPDGSKRTSARGADTELAFKEPAKRQKLSFAVLPIAKLAVISHQRKPSDPHVKRVVDSIERVGFLAPVVVVESDDEDGFLIIDGQHRYLAAQQLGLRQIPSVIVPRALAHRMLALNVEKEPNIRERSAVALSIYRELVETEPDLPEDDAVVADAVVFAHNVTLGLAYAESGRLAGSQYEPILKRCDGFMADRLADCLPLREERAAKVVEAHRLVRTVSDELKERGMWHEFVGAQIVSYANPLKRARKQHSFDDTFDKLLSKLKDLVEHPEKVLRAGG
jgi:ParB family chromosome partitioning protein